MRHHDRHEAAAWIEGFVVNPVLASVRLVGALDRPLTPWKNGQGRQRDLLRLPGQENWTVRASLAEITRDGPFSHFPGITRHFAIVSGRGVRLSIDGHAHEVGASDAALTFDGGASCHCTLLDGPAEALNLMLRRTAGGLHRVQPGVMHRAPLLRGLFGCDPGELVVDGQVAVARLPARTLAWFEPSAKASAASYGAAGWWIHAEAPA